MRACRVTAMQWLKRAAFAAICVAVIGMAWIGYRASDSQAAWATMWSLCSPGR